MIYRKLEGLILLLPCFINVEAEGPATFGNCVLSQATKCPANKFLKHLYGEDTVWQKDFRVWQIQCCNILYYDGTYATRLDKNCQYLDSGPSDKVISGYMMNPDGSKRIKGYYCPFELVTSAQGANGSTKLFYTSDKKMVSQNCESQQNLAYFKITMDLRKGGLGDWISNIFSSEKPSYIECKEIREHKACPQGTTGDHCKFCFDTALKLVNEPECLNKACFTLSQSGELINDNVVSDCKSTTLDGIKLRSISDNAFNLLKTTTKLSLNNNNLKTLSDFSPHSLPSLSELSCKKNEISVLSKDWFKNLNGLKTLNMGDNNIQTVEMSVFQDLKNLEYLNLSNNMVTSINLNGFQLKNGYPIIDFTGNGFDCCRHFQLISENRMLLGESFKFDCNVGSQKFSDLLKVTTYLAKKASKLISLSEGSCETCPQNGPYHIYKNEECMKCRPQLDCSPENNVNSCVFLDSATLPVLRCTKCVPGSKKMVVNGVCLPCKTDEYFDEINSVCQPCANDNAYYLTRQNECEKCLEQDESSCKTTNFEVCLPSYIGLLECTECQEGYGFMNGFKECVWCDKNYYLEKGHCLPCKEEYGLYEDEHQICRKCKTQELCDDEGDKKLNKCIKNLANERLMYCNSCAAHSIKTEIKGECGPCPKNMSMKNGECVDCSKDPRKYLQSSTNVCTLCKKQSPCIKKSDLCLENSKFLKCIECDGNANYYSYDGLCQICPANLKLFKGDCVDCTPIHGGILRQETCVPCKKQDACVISDENCVALGNGTALPLLKCTSCDAKKETFLSEDGICKSCKKSESYNSKDQTCRNCLEFPDYYIDPFGSCVECQKQDNCKEMGDSCINEQGSKKICKVCNENFYVSAGGICLDCSKRSNSHDYIDECGVGESSDHQALAIGLGTASACIFTFLLLFGIRLFFLRQKRRKMKKLLEHELLDGLTPEEFVMGSESRITLQTDAEYMELQKGARENDSLLSRGIDGNSMISTNEINNTIHSMSNINARLSTYSNAHEQVFTDTYTEPNALDYDHEYNEPNRPKEDNTQPEYTAPNESSGVLQNDHHYTDPKMDEESNLLLAQYINSESIFSASSFSLGGSAVDDGYDERNQNENVDYTSEYSETKRSEDYVAEYN